MNKQEINRKKNSQRAIRVNVKIYTCVNIILGEPSKTKIESWQFKTIKIKTYRHDYHTFTFVRCRMDYELKILVLKFEPNRIDRSLCQFLKKWDPRSAVEY